MVKTIKKKKNGRIDLSNFKEPVILKMGYTTQIFRGDNITVYCGKKQHTKEPFILINGERFKVV